MRSAMVHAVARCAIKRGGQLALHGEEGLENVADRLAEALGRCPACAHRAARKPQSQGDRRAAPAGDRRAAQARMREEHDRSHSEEEHDGRSRRPPTWQRAEQPPGSAARSGSSAPSQLVARQCAARRSHASEQTPSAKQPRASQTRPMRSSTPASCARLKRRLARLAEEDDAKELDHDVGGEGGGERDERGARVAAAC